MTLRIVLGLCVALALATLLYRRWLPVFDRMEDFLQRNLWKQERTNTEEK